MCLYFFYIFYYREFLSINEVFQYNFNGYVYIIFGYVFVQVYFGVGFGYFDYGFDVLNSDGNGVSGLYIF